MNNSISDILLFKFSKFVTNQMGLHFPKNRWNDLERGIRSAAIEFGFEDAVSCIQWLLSSQFSKNQIEILASHLTVGETYFLREKKTLEILENDILPELIRSHRGTEHSLRIWSAGCSTGEEPYSIAILLRKMIPDLKDWNITILATDINTCLLQKASEGIYNEWSFRDTPPRLKERYFKKTEDGNFEILPSIKKRVTFSYHNLAEDTFPSLLNNTNAMDIIFCRNVMMYFTSELARKVIKNLYRSLVDGGWLIVSPSETSHILFSQFVTVNFSDATLYKKDNKMPPTVEVFPDILVDEPKVSFQPPLDFINELDPEVTLSQETREPPFDQRARLPFKIEDRKTAESQPTPYLKALTLYKQGLYLEAADKILGLVSEKQDDPKAFTLLVRAFANQGRLAEALEWCEKAIASDKLNSVLQYLHATILQEQDLTDKAIISLKRALYLNQKFILAYFMLGNLSRQQGKFKESDKYFENALLLLKKYSQEDILPESEGITAGRLRELIRSIAGK
ncbi:MAG: chemotaxis protein CheR [Candidatus Cloacimonetes bacterium]|nr:chemotaxis protein CheR [Candidatus Cloacimonadota bacterium]